ncbi:Holliday junction resolvase RuvX [Ascidiimonas sp. W6]|uniref:Holliday junction resolvase RuvX n=1 Tax=Ascidiimonas meishanensis TaxID=3128903 RepID=UPI0030EF12E2
MGRILALDYGVKRTGIAVTDELQIIASGLTTVATETLIPFLKSYLAKEVVDILIIGEPKQMDNTPSESEKHIAVFIKKLAKELPEVPIERVDERFTSKMAVQSMIAGGVKKGKRRDKALVDEISATLILQSFLNK